MNLSIDAKPEPLTRQPSPFLAPRPPLKPYNSARARLQANNGTLKTSTDSSPSISTPRLAARRPSYVSAGDIVTPASHIRKLSVKQLSSDDGTQTQRSTGSIQSADSNSPKSQRKPSIHELKPSNRKNSFSTTSNGRKRSVSLTHIKAPLVRLSEEWIDKLRSNSSLYVSPEFSIGVGHTQHIFEKCCDTDDAFMSSESMELLCDDVITLYTDRQRIILKQQKPKATVQDIEKMLQSDLKHTVPGKNDTEKKYNLHKRFLKQLDKDKDGRISRSDFIFNWHATISDFFDWNSKNQSLSCTVM